MKYVQVGVIGPIEVTKRTTNWGPTVDANKHIIARNYVTYVKKLVYCKL